MTDLETLKRLAKSATPGPWQQELYEVDGSYEPMPQVHNNYEEIAATTYRRKSHDQHINDATYIAAANPQAILELIERLEVYEAALRFYSDQENYETVDEGRNYMTECRCYELDGNYMQHDLGTRALKALEKGSANESR